MSAFPVSGRSIITKISELTGRKRPILLKNSVLKRVAILFAI